MVNGEEGQENGEATLGEGDLMQEESEASVEEGTDKVVLSTTNERISIEGTKSSRKESVNGTPPISINSTPPVKTRINPHRKGWKRQARDNSQIIEKSFVDTSTLKKRVHKCEINQMEHKEGDKPTKKFVKHAEKAANDG